MDWSIDLAVNIYERQIYERQKSSSQCEQKNLKQHDFCTHLIWIFAESEKFSRNVESVLLPQIKLSTEKGKAWRKKYQNQLELLSHIQLDPHYQSQSSDMKSVQCIAILLQPDTSTKVSK